VPGNLKIHVNKAFVYGQVGKQGDMF
jgi:hypothetical protein